jgi:hypothetical protein
MKIDAKGGYIENELGSFALTILRISWSNYAQ